MCGLTAAITGNYPLLVILPAKLPVIPALRVHYPVIVQLYLCELLCAKRAVVLWCVLLLLLLAVCSPVPNANFGCNCICNCIQPQLHSNCIGKIWLLCNGPSILLQEPRPLLSIGHQAQALWASYDPVPLSL